MLGEGQQVDHSDRNRNLDRTIGAVSTGHGESTNDPSFVAFDPKRAILDNKESLEELEEQDKKILLLEEENHRLEFELGIIRGKFGNGDGNKERHRAKIPVWQLVVVMAIAMILGSGFSSKFGSGR